MQSYNPYQSAVVCKAHFTENDYVQETIHAPCLKDAVCNNYYENDAIIARDKKPIRASGGKCISPYECGHCNDGFYAYGPSCVICPKIDHCNHRRCKNAKENNHCVYCEGSVKPRKYWQAYILSNDKKTCKKTCSWRKDSTRCYPGSCDGELESNCKCAKGFAGRQCDIITEDVDISHAKATLRDQKDNKLPLLNNPSDPDFKSIMWSNNDEWKYLELAYSFTFINTNIPDRGTDHFVTDFEYGVIHASLKIEHNQKGRNRVGHNKQLTCYDRWNKPKDLIQNCFKDDRVNVESWGFQHTDMLTITCTVRNGGYLEYENREENYKKEIIQLKGRTVQKSFVFRWDLIQPYQECIKYGSKTECNQLPVDCKDFSTKPDIKVEWGGWKDDLSGIDHFALEVFELVSRGDQLDQNSGSGVENLSFETSEKTIKVLKPGVYSILLTAIDQAGNHKSARCLVLFDTKSVVEVKHTERIIVEEASRKTNYTWVSVNDLNLSVLWKDRFLNERHKKHDWLSGVKTHVDVQDEYDDLYGRRNVSAISNIHGIIKFEIKYEVYGPNLMSNQSFTKTSNILKQAEYLNITWEDGYRLDITVRAYDSFDKYKDDSISVYKDVSSPVIQNVWLTKGDRVNISVHSMEDFSKMTIEWEAFDYDSGLDQVEWRLYNNYTGLEEHGKAATRAQGNSKTLKDCSYQYGSAPRGPSCYCTMFQGCYHKHFQIRPEIVKDSGITPGKEIGLHDSDYYIEVTVTNKALLKTRKTIQITIDLSPPHEGYVHDGLKGDPEVDFQQDLQLHGHWEGFFDRESGVDFYEFVFSGKCINKTEMITSQQKKVTYNTYATFNAPSEGIFFVSVVAVNRASEGSNVVCSDGVTVTTSIPFIKDFVCEGVKARVQILKDSNGTLWLLDGNLIRHRITDFSLRSDYDLEVSQQSDALEAFPEGRPVKSIDLKLLNTNSYSEILGVLPRHQSVKWKSGVHESLIYDYAIGISSSPDSIAPDIYSFHSSKHNTHLRFRHNILVEGEEFYIMVKTTSQSGVVGYQSIGPFIVDKTPPKFKNDVIKVDNVNGYLLTSWSDDYVFDEEDPFPLQYEYAVGHTASQQDVQSFKSISSVGPCTVAYPPTCSAILLSDLQWPLHANHDYYISLRVTNVAGLSSTAVSAPFRYNTQLPSKGVVLDVLPREREMKGIKDVNDVDYTSNRTHLAAVWWGFRHPHLRIIFHICIGTEVGNCDNSTIVKRNSSYNYHVFKDLHLRAFQKYFITVKAIATTGTVSVSSDGLTVLDNTKILSEVSVSDGTKCTVGQNLSRSHHQFDTRPTCSEEIECQTSTSHVAAYWTVPNEHIDYTRETFIAVEERAHFGDFWKIFFNYTYVGKHNSFIIGDLKLQLGRFYRSSLRFCVESICFKPVKSDGFIVLHNYPKTGRIETVYKNISAMSDQLFVTMERMFDPDVEDMEEALSMVNHYEWAIGNDIGVQTQWMNVHEFSFPNATYMSFRLSLNESIDFSKCRKVHVRGYNKAGMWSIVSSDIKNCHVMDSDSFIIPNIVVDAIGKPERSGDGKIREGYGRDIFLELNAAWKESDIDYTSYRNILSAVWPKLRHRTYKWAVLEIINSDIAMYYRDAHLKLPEPCSNPYAIKCGDTEKEYVNVLFRDGEELKHGKRYMICIYAPQTVVTHEKWVETLEEFSGCSDGVTVDLTPPIPGNVWIGIDFSEKYQASTSDIYVNWNSFVDVEQFVETRHNSGIKEYYLAIGSTIGGSDVVPFTNIGIANHYTLHNLRLQNGHEYFASIKAYDFTGQSSTVTSQPVIIDNTPPERTKYQILITERHIRNFTELNSCWRGVFLDKESGIDYYLWGVGSRKGHDDVIAFTKTNQDCEVSTKHNDFDVNEGHSYFITVKAINRAHLINSASSLSYKVDQSAPIDGHVYDGCLQNATDLMKDIDYQVDSKTLFSHWEGFSDPHSTVKMYYISIGTCPRCQNVLQEVAVGTIYEFSLQNIHLTTGFNYFTTVTACNTADLCTSVTSDGVLLDDTPPTIGVVQDGVEKDDINYQFLRSYIACKWYGFTDPQSGLDKLSWTAGTKPSSDDIVPLTELPITNPIVNVNLTASLPLLKRIYVTVRVYNKAGLYSEASSNGFIIDETPPVFFENPFLVQDFGSIYKDSIVLRSSFKVKWTVEDKESFIDRQYISIGCHIGGNFSSSSIQLNGIVREYTFSRLDLHDGVKYIVHMISCNRAKLCTESKSDLILVDSSPPTPGMFAINTDHVSKLGRMIDGWMTWSKYKLWLSWLGFTDLHTGIEKYLVNVGSQYMQSDINKVKGSAEVFPHNDSGIDKGDEGFVQTFSIETVSLSPYEHIYVSVWAVNNVGLSSPMIHSQFRLVPGGSLELIRRCTSKTCLGHCVCSTQNGRCALEGKQCHDVSKDNTNNDVGVYDVTNLQDIPLSDIQYTPSVVELAAKWQVIQVHGLPPLWYEWSVGLATNDEPEGVFDNLKDVVWRHAGQTNQAFLSIERGREPLDESVTYSFFVRAWYTDDTYAVFKTNGVTVLSTPLATSKIKGSSVCEQRPGHWKKDIDYIKPGFPFTIKWSNVFINADKIIERFNIYLSSFPGGYDEHIANIDVPGTVTTYNVSRIPLTPGIVFYSNVVAYSFSGIHSTAISDGITVDIVPPSAGSVKDGTGIYDCDYQDDPQVVSASWHGFSDLDSVITHYMWCVQTVSELTLCNIRAWENVGIQTFVSRTLNGTSLSSGIKIQSLVYAVDIVGHESEIVKSNGVIVDVTQPIPVEMIHLDINLASNPSFELFEGNYMLLENETDYSSFCVMTEYVQLLNWTKKLDSCVIVLKSNRNNAFDGRSFVFLNGEISQNVSSLEEGQLYRITFVTAHPIWEGNDGANNEGFVQIGNERHVFLVYTKQDRHTAQTYDIPWHHHTFYFRPVLQNMKISLGSLFGNAGLYFDDARIQKVNMLKPDSNQTSGKHVINHIVTIHQWSSVHASWHFVDSESPIFDYTWAIGYTEGSTEVQGFQSVGLSNFAYNYNVSLPHTSTIHVTVIATNAAGLMKKIHAESLLVDKTPPEITCVNDGIGDDIDAQSESEISANWEVDDLESGLESCQFSIGYQLYGNELQTFQKIPVELRLLSKVFPYDLLFMRRIYVTIRCKNKAGLQSSLSTDGVIVSNLPPVSTRAKVNILPLSNTEYMAYNGYQKNKHTMRIKWSGFEDIVGLDSYLVSFKMDNNGDAIITRSITAEKQDITYLVLTGLDLKDGNYTVAVQAINKMYVRSDQVKASITISSLQPTIERSSTLHVSINNRTVHISWKDMFYEDRDTFYEVSAGTFVGSADIIQWQETKNTFITFFIPPRIKSIKGLTSYITVRGIYANGMFNVVNHRINLSDI